MILKAIDFMAINYPVLSGAHFLERQLSMLHLSPRCPLSGCCYYFMADKWEPRVVD